MLAVGVPATTGVNKARIILPFNVTIIKVYALANTIPVGNDLIFDININGTSIWHTTQANRVKILNGQSTGTQTSFDATSSSEGDIVSIDVDQIGVQNAGGSITIQLKVQII
jgi:hypothetical protein